MIRRIGFILFFLISCGGKEPKTYINMMEWIVELDQCQKVERAFEGWDKEFSYKHCPLEGYFFNPGNMIDIITQYTGSNTLDGFHKIKHFYSWVDISSDKKNIVLRYRWDSGVGEWNHGKLISKKHTISKGLVIYNNFIDEENHIADAKLIVNIGKGKHKFYVMPSIQPCKKHTTYSFDIKKNKFVLHAYLFERIDCTCDVECVTNTDEMDPDDEKIIK